MPPWVARSPSAPTTDWRSAERRNSGRSRTYARHAALCRGISSCTTNQMVRSSRFTTLSRICASPSWLSRSGSPPTIRPTTWNSPRRETFPRAEIRDARGQPLHSERSAGALLGSPRPLRCCTEVAHRHPEVHRARLSHEKVEVSRSTPHQGARPLRSDPGIARQRSGAAARRNRARRTPASHSARRRR